ncbi:His/Gly/Thr/Pro-type tRNA ligase C-terminal domain-containing protein [Candidatus Saccharibacteria bacterium]|nr:His/Gly/Thr/Pro-type tRNA ligase C-terminal domain-containing protein [Candidatus Saccharibacteria bacterium]
MKRSELFTKTSKSAPADEVSKNAQLLIRAGYISKEMAGAYNYLPLGLRVIENIKQVVREEMNAIGGQELLMTTLQRREIWEITDRWDSAKVDIWFKTELAAGGEVGLAPTHEEPLTDMLRQHINSYKDLPIYIYQFQTKFRNELRAKSGIMRGREFLMKDMYDFSASREEHEAFYERAAAAYTKVYDRLGIGDITYKTFASGGVFSKYSHEYQTLLDVGEDTIYMNADKSICINEEVFNDEVLADLGAKKSDFTTYTASEVGNIFSLGYKYSEPLGLEFTDKDGNRHYAYMGCYGIGISRLMGVIAEKFADDKGLVWPETITPFKYYLIGLGENGIKKCAEIYEKYSDLFLWDDRTEARAGEKFADAELMGIPHRVVISDKTLTNDQVEITDRKTGQTKLLTLNDFINKLY